MGLEYKQSKPLAYDQIISTRVKFCSGGCLLQQMMLRKLYIYMQKKEGGTYFASYNSKSNLKWIKHLILRSETTKPRIKHRWEAS